MATILNDRDEILQAASPRLNVVSTDYISFSASAPSFQVNGTTATPSAIVLSFILNGRLEGTPVITTSGVSSVTTTVVSSTLTQVSVAYANITAETVSITATLSYAGNSYTSTASISGSATAPAQVAAGVTVVPEGLLLRITWPKNTEIDVTGYEVRTSDSNWGADTSYLFRGNATSCAVSISAPTTAGSSKTYYIKAYDSTNLFSATARSAAYTIAAPSAPSGLAATYSASSATISTATLTWSNTVPAFGFKQYRTRLTLPNATTKDWITNTPNLTVEATWTGNASAVVYVTDILGNESLGSTAYTLTKNAPGTITLPATPATPVGTKLLLDWNEVTKTSLPIVAYEVRSSDLNWGDGTTFLWKGAVSECQVAPGALNTLTNYYVKAVDADNIYSSTAIAIPYTRTAPPAVTASTYEYSTLATGQSTVTFNWSRPSGETFAIDFYRVTLTKPGPIVITADTYSNSWTVNADWTGSATLTIQTVDIFGVVSSTFTKTIYKVPPSTVSYTIATPVPVNNTLLLSWTPTVLKAGLTWSRATTTATITDTAHGYATNDTINITSTSDVSAIPVGVYVVTVLTANTYTIVCLNAGAASGTVTLTNGSLQHTQYEVRASNNTTVLYKGSSANYAVQANNIVLGSNTYYLYAIDSAGKYSSNSRTISYTYTVLGGITGSAVFTSIGTALFKWNQPATGSFAAQEYSLSLNGPGGSAIRSTTDWEIPVKWSNATVTLTITPKDVLGTTGTASTITLTNAFVGTPGIPAPTLRGTDLELDWADNIIDANTQLPIGRYELKDASNNVVWKGSQSKAVISLVGLTPSQRTWTLYAYDTNGYPCVTPRTYEYTSLVVPTQIPIGTTSYSFGTNISDSLLTLSWAAQTPLFGLKHYKISYSDNGTTVVTTVLSNSVNISPIPKNSGSTVWTGDKVFSVSVVDQLGNESITTGITVSKSGPGNITGYTAQVIDNNVLLQWILPARTTLPIDTVRIKKGSTWATATSIGDKTGTFTTILERAGGSYTYWIAAVDTDGVEGNPSSITATVAQPPDYVFSGQQYSKFTGGTNNAVSSTDKGTGVTIVGNLITGTGGAGGWQSVRGTKAFTTGKWYWETKVVSNGTYPNTWMAGVATTALAVQSQYVGQDAASWGYYNQGNTLIGPSTSQVASGSSSLIVGDVLGLALDTAAGTLRQYKNGVLFATMTGVTGTLYPAFTTFGYGESLLANFGEVAFAYQVPTGYNGYVNAIADAGSLMLPVDTTSTWTQHYTSNSWATPDAQIAAGYPVYIQPTLSSGSYEELFDFGATLSSTKVNVNLLGTVIAGAITVTTTIDISANGTTWLNAPYTGTSMFAVNFRYVKVKITVTQSDGGKGTYRITNLDVALDSKQKTDSNTAVLAIGAAQPQGNIAHDYIDLWVPGSLPTTYFGLNGNATENSITSVAGPGGYVQAIWNCIDNDLDTVGIQPDGGWNTANFTADVTKGHLFAVFMKTTTNNGTSYWGLHGGNIEVLDLVGTTNTNPYFWAGDLPIDTWYLVVGYLHEAGYGTTDTGISGVYNLSGTKVQGGTEFKAAVNCTSLMHRCYHYYNATASGSIVQQMARPVVVPCTVANAPTMISYLLQCATGYGASVTPASNFIDVISITATPQGNLAGSASTPLVDFNDIPNPRRFNIFNYTSGGALTGGTVSWAVRGY